MKRISFLDGRLSIETTDAQQAMLGMIAAFNEADIVMDSLKILEPNLESVFLHLTGKRLRD
ncbi:MAG: hypothetical protein QME66_12460 [Candidatus Eisenbacteria bacterium]|nr:hypothetical protein [Candidatus Eisenbacteria bacterium]